MLFTIIVTADSLHLRQGAGQTFDSLGFLVKDEKLSVIGIDASGTWLQVKQAGKNGKQGWCGARYVLPQAAQPSPWLPLAVREIGVKEMAGLDTHPRIRDYLATVNDLSALAKSQDETAWCSCFINWCVERVQLNGTDSASAKSWGNWRTAIAPDQAQTGDIAVFDRSSASNSGGHVGIFITRNAETDEVLLLGGNQSDAVRYAWYPINAIKNGTHYTLLSCRRLA